MTICGISKETVLHVHGVRKFVMKMKMCVMLFLLSVAASFDCTLCYGQQLEHACYPTEVYAAGNRVHVRCADPAPDFSLTHGAVVYFAVPAASPLSNDLVSMASTALAAGKWLRLYYDFSAVGTSFGCLERDCRPLTSVSLVPYTLTPRAPHDEPVEKPHSK